MTDRQFFRLLGSAALVVACLFSGRAGWGIAHNDAAVVLTFVTLSGLCALMSVLFFSLKGGDDGID